MHVNYNFMTFYSRHFLNFVASYRKRQDVIGLAQRLRRLISSHAASNQRYRTVSTFGLVHKYYSTPNL